MQEVTYAENRIFIAVDSYASGIMSGRVSHYKLDHEEEFTGLEQLMLTIEKILDFVKFPAASTSPRRFSNTTETMEIDAPFQDTCVNKNVRGERANFIVQILYRQQSTWQGKIKWCEKNKVKSFRSDIEFIKFLSASVKAKK